MNPIHLIQSYIAPLCIDNIDTDVIIPQTELVTIQKKGLGKGLFARWRGEMFILDQNKFKNAGVMLVGKNFGCGSSREHAVWALMDFGIRCVIAPSFGEIFYHNALKNGLVLAIVAEQDFEIMKNWMTEIPIKIVVDIKTKMLYIKEKHFSFHLSSHYQKHLLMGLDEIDETLLFKDKILAFQQQDKLNRGWVY